MCFAQQEAQGLCGTSSGSTAGDVADDTAPVTDQHLHLAPAADVSTASQPEPVPPADMAVAIATPDQDADVTATAKDQGADLATVSTDHVVPDADVSKAADETEDADVGSHDKDVVTDVHGAAELQPARRVSSYEIEEVSCGMYSTNFVQYQSTLHHCPMRCFPSSVERRAILCK